MCNNVVCLKVEAVPTIMAKFISPPKVQQSLLKGPRAILQVLHKKVRVYFFVALLIYLFVNFLVLIAYKEIGILLHVEDKELKIQLKLLRLFGVCYKLPAVVGKHTHKKESRYLLPSLGIPKGSVKL